MPRVPEEDEKNEGPDSGGEPGEGGDPDDQDQPFYKKKQETPPDTEDRQLKYAVDLLRALLITQHAN